MTLARLRAENVRHQCLPTPRGVCNQHNPLNVRRHHHALIRIAAELARLGDGERALIIKSHCDALADIACEALAGSRDLAAKENE